MQRTEKQVQTFNYSTEDLYDLSIHEEMDDNEYMLELLTILLLEIPRGLKQMKEALNSGRADIVSKKAHSLKGPAGVILAVELTGVLSAIEAIGKFGPVSDELSMLVENAIRQYSTIERSLKIYVKNLRSSIEIK